MNSEVSDALKKLLGRELESAERDRLERIQDALNLGPNDSLWAIIAALEFQRVYYEELPEKIRHESEKICCNIKEAVEREAVSAQIRLGESMAEHIENLSLGLRAKTWLAWGALALVLLMIFGWLNMWAGYCIGTGKVRTVFLILHMPAGLLLGGVGMIGGVACGIFAGAKYIGGDKKFHWLLASAVAAFTFGGILFSMSL